MDFYVCRNGAILSTIVVLSWFTAGCDQPTNFYDSGTGIASQSSEDAAPANGDVPRGEDHQSATQDADPGFADPGTESPGVLEQLGRLPKFGMLVNDLQCGLCHVTVLGDVVSTRDVHEPRHDSETKVLGRWLAAKDFSAGPWVRADGGIEANYKGPEIPRDVDNDGQPDFPRLDVTAVSGSMRGSVKSYALEPVEVNQQSLSHTVLVGTLAKPIELRSDVFINGDLVIKGYYKGNGTLYVAGNIYIPADLRAVRSAFPYSSNPDEATKQGQDHVKNRDTDSLGLATNKSIFIADLESHSPGCCSTSTVYTHPSVPADRQAGALGVFGVYDWFPGGKAAYEALYENGVSCQTGKAEIAAGFNIVEAFLFAGNTVAGISRRASYTIRGGVIADFMHILSGAMSCPDTVSPVHGLPQNRSYIEYDYRIKTGLLKMLEHVAPLFQAGP